MTERIHKARPRNRMIVNKAIAPYLFVAPIALFFMAFLIVRLV
jgi:hypothetical protein